MWGRASEAPMASATCIATAYWIEWGLHCSWLSPKRFDLCKKIYLTTTDEIHCFTNDSGRRPLHEPRGSIRVSRVTEGVPISLRSADWLWGESNEWESVSQYDTGIVYIKLETFCFNFSLLHYQTQARSRMKFLRYFLNRCFFDRNQ